MSVTRDDPPVATFVDHSALSEPPPFATPVDDPGWEWAGVPLGPSLPMAVYTAIEAWNPERVGALALYCCDGRWGEAFDEFCHRRLHIPRYDRWAVPGGPAWLVPRANGDDVSEATRQQLDFLVKVHQLERIVLITHYGCAYYGGLLSKGPDECLPTQVAELATAKTALHEQYPALEVEAYLAMQRGRCLSFHRVEA